jgi:uncharacterized protein (TIGR02996 family)
MDDDLKMRRAIEATPDDDRPRAVYADWLSSRGDPLGFFIAAQLRRDNEAAAPHLEAARAATALPLLGVPGLGAFRRGFLVHCLTSGAHALPAVDQPGWALVEHLRLGNPRAADFIDVVGARLTSLRTFETDTGDAVEALARRRPRPLENLKVHALSEWFDLSPLVDDQTVLTVSVLGSLEVGREAQRVHLSPPRGAFDGRLVDAVLRAVVRPDDEVVFVSMGSLEPLEATRRALQTIPHRHWSEHVLGVVG